VEILQTERKESYVGFSDELQATGEFLMKLEPTQRGNPHRLTIWPHVFPAESIRRFANPDGRVAVTLCETGRQFRVPPEDKIFSAKRVLDQRAETGYMKDIEDKFQALADQIVGGRKSLESEHCKVVRMFFALWWLRFNAKNSPVSDKVLVGIEPEPLTKDQQEILEGKGVAYIRADRKMPGRVLSGSQIQIDIDRFEAGYAGLGWGVATAARGEFILPDTLGQLVAVPVTPTICLLGGHANVEMQSSEVSRFNRLAVKSAITYFIARDPAQCPR